MCKNGNVQLLCHSLHCANLHSNSWHESIYLGDTEHYYTCVGSVEAFHQQPKNMEGYKKAIAKGIREV